ncbi:MAG: DUF3347 domain-containing protein [Verrucomicrobia bacterium]|nr:DUF3347 domain-containing protein [Verrucomicrobiota bacterium]
MKALRPVLLVAAGALLATGVPAGCSRNVASPAAQVLPETTRALLDRYEKVRAALAGDQLNDAKFQAEQLASEAQLQAGKSEATEAVRDLAAAAATMAKEDTVVRLRDDFKLVSAAAIKLAAGAPGYFTLNCPMTKDGDWLQTDTKVSNPYFGKSMQDCGVVKH